MCAVGDSGLPFDRLVRSLPQRLRAAATPSAMETQVAWNTNSGTNNALYFIVGGLVVVVAVLAYMYFGGHLGDRGHKAEITIELPKAP